MVSRQQKGTNVKFWASWVSRFIGCEFKGLLVVPLPTVSTFDLKPSSSSICSNVAASSSAYVYFFLFFDFLFFIQFYSYSSAYVIVVVLHLSGILFVAVFAIAGDSLELCKCRFGGLCGKRYR